MGRPGVRILLAPSRRAVVGYSRDDPTYTHPPSPPFLQETPAMSNLGGARHGCADFRRSLSMDRRSFLRAGLLGAAGLSLAELLRAESRPVSAPKSKAGR